MVHYLTDLNPQFSATYLEVRKIEQRIFSDEEVALLPFVEPKNRYFDEWKVRQKSCQRFLNYLSKKTPSKVLDIGCGNGWFSNQMAKTSSEISITALDINDVELEQASRVFHSSNLKFIYADLFKNELSEAPFDIIVLNSCVQYFHDIEKLKLRLNNLLNENGEVHFIDSPFYKKPEIEKARQRTVKYYQSIKCESMAQNYFHHSEETVKDFDILYHPNKLRKLLFGIRDSPFLWLRATKNQLI